MNTRTYVVKMPTSVSTTPLDILVQNSPGTQAAPVVAGGDGAYYEMLGRPLRIPVLAAAGASAGFVPRLRLGFSLSIAPIKTAIVTDLPGVQLSASLASLSSTDSGPTISVPALADPAGGPAIRLIGGAGTAGGVFVVTLQVLEAKDVDRDSTGAV